MALPLQKRLITCASRKILEIENLITINPEEGEFRVRVIGWVIMHKGHPILAFPKARLPKARSDRERGVHLNYNLEVTLDALLYARACTQCKRMHTKIPSIHEDELVALLSGPA